MPGAPPTQGTSTGSWQAALDTRRNPITLEFRGELEQQYLRHSWAQGRSYVFRLCLFGALANIGFWVSDSALGIALHPIGRYLQLAVMLPLFLIGAGMTLTRLYGPPIRWVMLAIYVLQTTSFVVVALLSSHEGGHRTFPFLTALILAGGLLFRLSFVHAMLVNVALVGTYVWGSLSVDHVHAHSLIDQTLTLGTFLLLGGLLHYSFVSIARQEFVHGRELALQATTDSLTGLHNRRHFVDVIDAEFARAQREGRPLACLMFDLDHFKQINDSYGHRAGDAVLRAAAKILRGTCRPYDVVARYGGEEFVALLPGSSLDGAQSLAERCRAAIEVLRIPFEQRTLTITTSAGIASSRNPHVRDADSLLRCADEALYRAKLAGRNRTIVADGEVAEAPEAAPATELNVDTEGG